MAFTRSTVLLVALCTTFGITKAYEQDSVSHQNNKKLKCFGENTCPDWVLVGLYSIAGLTAPRAKSLAMMVAENLTGEPLQEENIKSILADIQKDSSTDMKKVLASMLFALTSASKWGSDGSQLDADLRSVGVASEVTRGLRVALDHHGSEIGAALRKQTLTLTRLKDVSTSKAPDGSIECIELNMKIEDVLKKTTKDHSFLIQERDLGVLLSELKKARSLMDNN